jgi:DNA-binding transcriptional regulator YiaG
VATSPRRESAIASDAMTGSMLQQFRKQLDLSHTQLSRLVGCTPASLKHWEQRDSVIPIEAAAGVRALLVAKQEERITDLPGMAKRGWRESRTFKQKPPFEVLPSGAGRGAFKFPTLPFLGGA